MQRKQSISTKYVRQKSISRRGNTALHNVLREHPDSHVVGDFIRQVGLKSASIMAKTLNNKNKLPIDIIAEANLGLDEIEKLYSLILPLTLPSLKPLSEQLDFESVKATYQTQHNSTLEYHLDLATQAVNYARQYVHVSTTHPELNNISRGEYDVLARRLRQLRDETSIQIRQVINDDANKKYRFKNRYPCNNQTKIKEKISKTAYEKIIKIEADASIYYNEGNCAELASIGLSYLKNLLPRDTQISVERFSIQGGDHVFLVIGRGSKSNNYKDWHKDAVVCDPWSGKVYLASDIPSELGNFTRRTLYFGKNMHYQLYNFVTRINFTIHTLQPAAEIFKHKYTKKHIIEHKEEGYLDTFLKKLHPYFTEKEMLHFYKLIKPRIQEALDTHVISEQELEDLPNPIPTLYALFINEHGLMGLNASLFTLTTIARMPSSLVSQLMSKKGLHYLTEIKHLQNQQPLEWVAEIFEFNRYIMQKNTNNPVTQHTHRLFHPLSNLKQINHKNTELAERINDILKFSQPNAAEYLLKYEATHLTPHELCDILIKYRSETRLFMNINVWLADQHISLYKIAFNYRQLGIDLLQHRTARLFSLSQIINIVEQHSEGYRQAARAEKIEVNASLRYLLTSPDSKLTIEDKEKLKQWITESKVLNDLFYDLYGVHIENIHVNTNCTSSRRRL